MKAAAISIGVLACTLLAGAQVAAPAASRVQSGVAASPRPVTEDPGPLLTQIQQTAQAMNLDISRLRIKKWKTGVALKHQAQANADSIVRNLTAAFPAILDEARANPQSLAAAFRLYRNLDALYEVFCRLAETSETFGTADESGPLSRDASSLAQLRHSLGDRFQTMAAGRDSEVVSLRAAAQAPAAPPAPPKKTVVDDDAPRKTVHKKAVPKPAPSPPAANPPTTN
jgi:hypothetical protein